MKIVKYMFMMGIILLCFGCSNNIVKKDNLPAEETSRAVIKTDKVEETNSKETEGYKYLKSQYNFQNEKFDTEKATETFILKGIKAELFNDYLVVKWDEVKVPNIFGYLIVLTKNGKYPSISN